MSDNSVDNEHVKKMRVPEGLLENETVSVVTPHSKVSLSGGRMLVTDPDGQTIGSYPIGQVTTLNLFGSVGVTTPLIHECADQGISINYFSFYGRYKGSFVPVLNTIALVRRFQAGISQERALHIAQKIIAAKIKNSRVFLARKKVTVPGRMKELEHDAAGALSHERLRAIEGEAASIYFSLLSGSLSVGWVFTTRTRRPPRDELNSLLSLTYTMVLNEVISALHQYNLDPFIGVLHVDRHGRPALALDLIEEFRSVFCDAFVVRLINREMIQKSDFTEELHLSEPAFKRYLGFFGEYMQEELKHPRFSYAITRRKVIQIQAILLRKAICGELKSYHPFVYVR